jgi:hypothetical protein
LKPYKIRIGNKESDASYFDEKKRCVFIPIKIKIESHLLNNNEKDIHKFERILFLCGTDYDRIEHDHFRILFLIKIKRYKELVRICDAIKEIYKSMYLNVDIEIGKECKEFLE